MIPLRPRAKVPQLNAWSQYATQLPTEAQQAQWLEAYSDGNIGLALGPQSGLVALDIDSVDPRVGEVLKKVMPYSPWKRVGKKGAVYAFRYNGERTFRIKDENNDTIMELLSRGAQVVLPPSIHPDTQLPYEANCDLVEVYDQLVGLPADFEHQLRQALIAAGFQLSSRGVAKVAEWVPAGGRDSAMTAHAGILARAVIRGERTLAEATHEMEVWVNTYTEKVAGDPLDPEKAMKKVVEFVRRDVTEGGRRLPPDWSEGLTAEEVANYHDYFGHDSEEWTIERYVGEIAEIATKIPADNVADRDAAIDRILVRMAKDQHLNELSKATLLKQLQMTNGKQIQYAALKARLKELTQQDLVGENHTELAEALQKELEREGEVRFANGRFYRWMGAHWEEIEEHVILRTLAREFGHFAAARKYSDHRGILNVLQKLVTKELREDETRGVNFANGFLTTDMQMLNHDPRFGCTYVLPYRYVNESRLPLKFLGVLDRAWGLEPDFDDRVQALREAIAATLFGMATHFTRAICLYGLPHTGKTTIVDVVKGLIPGEAVAVVEPEKWGERFQSTGLIGKLMNFAGELDDSKLIPGKNFKLIVEGEEIQGEFKGQTPFKFRPECAHWFATNHLPRTRDNSGGFTRRWLFLDFNTRLPTEGRTTRYHEEILAEEREHIVAWALPAIQDLLHRQEYTLPACHKKREAEVAAGVNSVRAWMESSHVILQPGAKCIQKDLFNDYFAYARMESRSQPYSLKRFQGAMEELGSEVGFKVRTLENGDIIYEGLTLERLSKRAA